MHVWTKTMHRCAEITVVMDSIVSENRTPSKHKELFVGRVKRDYEDFNKIKVITGDGPVKYKCTLIILKFQLKIFFFQSFDYSYHVHVHLSLLWTQLYNHLFYS